MIGIVIGIILVIILLYYFPRKNNYKSQKLSVPMHYAPNQSYVNFASVPNVYRSAPIMTTRQPVQFKPDFNKDLSKKVSSMSPGVILNREHFSVDHNKHLKQILNDSKDNFPVFDISPIPVVSPQLKKLAATIALRPDVLI